MGVLLTFTINSFKVCGKMDNESTVIIFCWYQPEEWAKLKIAVDDPSSLDDTYDDWRKKAESALFELRSQGHVIRKVALKVEKLLAWCAENHCKPDSEYRTQYAIYLENLKKK